MKQSKIAVAQSDDRTNRCDAPVNSRYCALCIALEIRTQDESTEEFYCNLLSKKLLALIDSRFVLRAGSVSVTRVFTSGPSHSLKGEFNGGSAKSGTLDYEVACPAVYRTLGFIWSEDEQRWVMLPKRWIDRKADQRAAEKSRKKSAWQKHIHAYSVVPHLVRERIFRLWESEPEALYEYAGKAIAYLEGPATNPLPDAPWNRMAHFKNGHGFIFEFLCGVGEYSTAETVITVASINNYITASIGQEQVMKALRNGARVRFLIFDFLNGDAKRVAGMIHRSEQAFYSNASDSVEALRELLNTAREVGLDEKLEIRLLEGDPVGRWYIWDTPSNPRAFVVRRDPDTKSKAAAVEGGRLVNEAALEEAKVVNELWSKSHAFEDWLKSYDVWKAKPETRRMLGLDE